MLKLSELIVYYLFDISSFFGGGEDFLKFSYLNL